MAYPGHGAEDVPVLYKIGTGVKECIGVSYN